MRELLVVVLAAATGCATGGPTAAPSPARPVPSVRATPLPHRPAAAAILGDGEVELARVGGRDHVGLTQAAEEEENQPLALSRYRAWGWLDEATRQWAAGDRRLELEVLTLTNESGARLAYSQWPAATAAPAQCPAEIGADQCRLTADAGRADLVAQVGPYVFHLRGFRLEPAQLIASATRQVMKLREG